MPLRLRLARLSGTARHARLFVPLAAIVLAACSLDTTSPERHSADPDEGSERGGVPFVVPASPAPVLQSAQCTVDVKGGTVACQDAPLPDRAPTGSSRTIIGGQDVNVRLTASNTTYNAADSLLAFDVTIQNLLPEALGTLDGVTPDADGVMIFLNGGPTATSGAGTVTVHNADGTALFTATDQPFFRYNQVLAKDEVSAVKRWEMKLPPDVATISFTLYVAAEVERKLVINEFMANPGGTVQDSVGEYVEVYNAGRLRANMRGFLLSDYGAIAPDTIKVDLIVPAGGYVVLGRSNNTAINGGLTFDYLYTSRVGSTATTYQLSNAGTDFLRLRSPGGITMDSVSYASGTVTAVAGVARELKNPALDNTAADGPNWGAATVAYHAPSNNRGTPRAQNTNFAATP